MRSRTLCLLCLISSTVAAADPLPFPAGTMEQAATTGRLPAGWSLPKWADNAGTRVVVEGNAILRVAWPHIGHLQPTCAVAVDPRWQRVRIGLRLRVEQITLQDGGAGFMMRASFLDKAGQVLRHADTTAVDRPTDWSTLSAECAVPAGAAFLRFNPGLFGASGNFDLDDLTVTPTWDGTAPAPLPELVPVPDVPAAK